VHTARTLFVTSLVLVPVFVHAGVFAALVGFVVEPEADAAATTPAQNPEAVPLLRAVTNADPNASRGGGDIIVDEDGSLVPSLGPAGLGGETTGSNGEISVYVVREGDSLSQIAEMFGVSVNTILWANEVKSAKNIQPGDTLVILPVSGVRHVVKAGDSLKKIAEKYHGDVDDIIAYNQLADASDIAPGDTVVIPGGEAVAAVSAKGTSGGGSVAATGSGGSSYYSHPVPGAVRTQGIHGYNGVDLGAPIGTGVRAAAAGEVILARASGWNGGYGSYIVIKHPNGTQTLYAHLSSVGVSVGEAVAQGEIIGAVGTTGRSTGAHLHFEVRGAKNPF
jgi:LysM repeat protein